MKRLRKIADFILALVMMVSLYPSVPMAAQAADASFTGSGTETDPFIIQNNADLVKLSGFVNAANHTYNKAHYKLSDTFDNSGDAFAGTPIGDLDKPFMGHFNGNFKTVHLNVSDDGSNKGGYYVSFVGLFGAVSGSGGLSYIKNLRVTGTASATGTKGDAMVYTGAIAGLAVNAFFQNCASEATVSSTGLGDVNIGGILGISYGSVTVRNSYFIGSLAANENAVNYIGGIVGYMQDTGLIANCYTAASFPASNEACTRGALVGTFDAAGKTPAAIQYCAFANDTNHAPNNVTGSMSGVALTGNLGATTESMKQAAFLTSMNTHKSADDASWVQSAGVNGGYPYLLFDGSAENPPAEDRTIDVSIADLLEAGTGWTYNADTGVYTINDGADVTVTGDNARSNRRLEVAENATAKIRLDGAVIIVDEHSVSPLKLNNGSNVTLYTSGGQSSYFQAGTGCAGIEVPVGATLTTGYVDSESKSYPCFLTVKGGSGGAGIGGNDGESAGTINITGSKSDYGSTQSIQAWGGKGGQNGAAAAAVGGGAGGAGGKITVNGGSLDASSGSSNFFDREKGPVPENGASAIGAGAGGDSTSPATQVSIVGRYEFFVDRQLAGIVGGTRYTGVFPWLPGYYLIVLTPVGERGASSYTVISGTISLADDGDPEKGHINLANETISIPFTVAAYSIDGGKKWKAGALPTDKKLTALFTKGMTLWVTDDYNKKDIKEEGKVVEKKGPADGAKVIQFPKINKRPKANPEKLKPYYGETAWLPYKNGTAELENPAAYEWVASTDGKNPSGDWVVWNGTGFTIAEPGKKETYLFRTAPVAEEGNYVPGGKTFKIKPKAMVKAPNLNADGAKGILKLKKGMYYQVGSNEKAGGSSAAAVVLKIVQTPDGDNQVPGGDTIVLWIAANGKKPPSAKQTLTLPAAPPATIS